MSKDLYILIIWQGVEPVITGPFGDDKDYFAEQMKISVDDIQEV